MKNRLFLLVMFIMTNLLNGQSYILDNTYGTQGYVFNANNFLNPIGVLKLNQSYYYYSNNKISKTNYNGSLDMSFGVNSEISLNNSNETYTINGGKIINNSIYLFGKIVNINNSSEDGFILKILDSGTYDIGFGLNGISKVNLGQNENIFDFCVDNSGKLFCAAIQANSSSSKVITFKLLSNGITDIGFGTNSVKEYVFNPLALSNQNINKIIKVSDGYLLIGLTSHMESPQSTGYNKNIVIAKVDESGDYINSFGTNGIKLIPLSTNTLIGYTIKDAQLFNSNLYIQIFESHSFSTMFTSLRKINLNDFQTNFNVMIYYESNFKLDADENIYVVGSNRCDIGPCLRDFMLRKYNSSGVIDLNFAQNGTYTYRFQGLSAQDYKSSVVNLDEDGKIVIGGRVFMNYFDSNNVYVPPTNGFSSIRINQGALNNELFDLDEDVTIFPNPVTDILSLICKDEIKEIKIFDMQKKLILLTNKLNNNNLNLSGLDAGLYIVEIRTDNNTSIKKIIKK
jgi:hypothetical protein